MKVNNNPKKRLAMRKYSYVWILFLSLFMLSFGNHQVVAQQNAKQHVLVLNSYHQGFSWTNRIVAGIDEVFAEAGLATELHIEYMDTKRLLTETYLTDLYQLYKDKYATVPIDLIIVSDNNGLEFLRTYGEELFPGIPIVFTGINNFSDDLLNGFDQITGVAEETDIAATLELMLNLHPNTEQIYILNDKTPSGIATLASFEEVRPQFEDQVEFVIYDDFAVPDMQQELATLPANSLILMLLVNRDNTGQFYSYEESLTLLSQNTQVPIYGVWDFYIGYGIVGGKLTDGTSQGRAAGEMALRILQGESAADIPVLRSSPNQYMFDYEQLQQFGIDTTQLPTDSLILNRTPTFYELNKTYIWIAAAVFAILTMAIVVLLINISRRRRVENELQQSFARRGRQVKLSTQVTQDIIGITNLEEIYQNIVQQIKEQFGYYHIQILQYDPEIGAVRLIAGYGDIGAQMLTEGHQLEMGQGLIGHAAATGESVLRSTLSNDPDWKPNPLLPETKGEIAVPITLGTEILGVLDVQSDEPGVLNADDQLLLEGLCGQIAIAIENARQYDRLEQSQNSIKERENLLHTIIDATPDWIFAKDIDHRYMLLNKAFADTLQLPPDEIIGKHDLEIGVPEDIVKGDTEKGISGIWPGEREVMDSGQIKVVEEEAYTPDGQPITLTTVRVPLRDAEGNVSGMVGFIHDITDLKQYERELQEANVRTQEILESINVPLVISRISDGIVAYVNEPLAEMIRVPREELIGQMTPDFYQDPADREAYLTGLREKGQVSNYDLPLKRGDGDSFWTLVSGRVINFQGDPAIISSLVDITERKQHEATALIEGQHQAAINEILEYATTSSSVDELLQLALDQILGLSWMPVQPEGGVFLKEPGVQRLKLVVNRNLSPQLQVLCAKVPFGHCLCGRAAATGEVQFASCVNDAHDISFEGMAPHGHYNIPLITDDNQNVGVMVFYLEHGHQRDENEVSFLKSAGRTIANIVQRKQAEMVQTKQANELSAVAQVSTAAATILEPNQLLQQVVDLTKEQFDLYHAHLYLLDENKNNLVLTNGAGEIGTAMVAEGRKIELSQKQSLVARAARTREGVVINDVQAEPGFLPHPLLPETCAELAVPLIAGNEVQGVLDVQADSINRFTAEDINIFTTLASQIAVALQNARRHEEAQKSLDELTRLQRIMVREGWEDYLTAQERPFFGYAFNTKGAKPIKDAGKEVAAKETENDTVGTSLEMAIPIVVRGELIGKISLRNPDGTAISERKQALTKTVAHQVSEALERARLTAQTQQALAETNEQARRLTLLNELSETISRMTTIEEIASAVMNMVPEILRAKRLSLHLIAEEDETMLRMVGVAGAVTDMLENELIPLAASPMAQALEKRQIVAGLPTSGKNSLQTYHVPLYAAGRPLGTFDMVIAADAELDDGDQQILLQMASLLGSTLENRRLFNQTKARADRERLLNTITQKIQSTVTMESALQTAVSELGQALKLKKAIIEMSTSKQSNGQS